MTYDSASALSAASGQLQHRATAANPFALKPWVWPKTVRATALTTSHGTTLAGAPALRVAFVITTAPLALAAALTMTLLAAQVAVNWARSSGDAACSGVNSLQLAVSAAGKGGEGMRKGTL